MTAKLATIRLRCTGALAAVLLCGSCAVQPQPAPPAQAASPPAAAVDTGRSCASAIPGVETVDASRALRRQHGLADDVHGAMIVEVLPGGPAALAGLAVWDVVERLDAHEITGAGDFDDKMKAARCGEPMRVTVRRGSKQLTTSLSPVDSIRFYTAACRQGLATGSSLSPGNATACTSLGRMYRDGRGVEQDPGRAVEIFTRVCGGMSAHPDDRDAAAAAASACSLIGAQYAHGSGVAADWGRAIALSRQGCDGGDAFGCFNLGAVYLNGEGADRDAAAALAFFRRACDLRDGKGCFQVGLMYYQGQGATRSNEQAAAFFRKACDEGHGTGCVNLGGFYTSDVSRKLALLEAIICSGKVICSSKVEEGIIKTRNASGNVSKLNVVRCTKS